MNVPAVVELQDTVAVPEPVTVPGVIAPQVSPAGTVSVSVTTPAKPFTAVIVTVDTADCPTLTAAGEDAAMVKSTKLNVAVAMWIREPLVPVMVTVNWPLVVELHDRLEVADEDRRVTVTLGGVSEQVSPAGTEAAERLMVPLKSSWLVTVMVEEPGSPALTMTEVGLALTVKSGGSVMTTLAVWESDPLVPTTVTIRELEDDDLHDKVEV